jgi:hypothetical protein
MTGRTFDFMDVAPASLREESVRQWAAWWNANREAIKGGADPKELEPPEEAEGAGEAEADEAAASGSGRGRATPRRGTGLTVGRATARPRGAGESEGGSGRGSSIRELVRRKRMRRGTPLPGATPGAFAEEKPPEPESAPSSAEDSSGTRAPSAPSGAGRLAPAELPEPDDEELPPPT